MSTNESVLNELLRHEEELQFAHFTNENALELGLALLGEARARPKPVTIDISRNGQQLFHFAMQGTSADNDQWIRRKNNVVNRFGHSSLYLGTYLQQAGQTIEEKYLISSHEFAAHGGAFPLIIKGVGVVGTITVSGLPQKEDHELVVTTIRQFLAQKEHQG
ncbi:MAG TPA: heme-degrading domain-containing protein [Ktedonobacterales bacterium]|jgi:uncharacterized protein (UPF0303 family)